MASRIQGIRIEKLKEMLEEYLKKTKPKYYPPVENLLDLVYEHYTENNSITPENTVAGKAAKEKEKKLETWLRGLPRMDEMVEDYGIDIPLSFLSFCMSSYLIIICTFPHAFGSGDFLLFWTFSLLSPRLPHKTPLSRLSSASEVHCGRVPFSRRLCYNKQYKTSRGGADMEQRRICPYCMQELEAGEEQCPHCGRELAGRNPSGSLPAGTVLAGRYTVGDIQSVDGEGILYRGVENNGPFRVTIKEYMPLTLAAERGRDCILRPKPGSEVLFKTTRMDFADLYRFIQRITPANGLEAVLDVFEENNTVYAVMENPGGCPLQKWLEEHGTVTPQQACAMLEPVFNGVEAMHQVGLVHRGICPANIRIMDNGRARLTGYATVGLRTAGSGLHEQLYEGYSAPEQYSTAEFEGRYTDEYSLAAVFYRMVCGLSPVPAAQRLVSDSNPKARTVTSSVSAYVSETLYLGLRLKPVERIQTVQQLFRALSEREYAEELSRSMEVLDPPAPAPQEPKAPAKAELLSVRNLLAGIVILLSVLILLTLWGLLSHQSEKQPEVIAPESVISEAASEPVSENVTLTPDFVGRDYDAEVRNNRSYIDEYLFYVTLEYSDTVEKGRIIRQSPEAGEVIQKGDTVSLVVSRGPQMMEMPDIIGQTQDSAVQELATKGLNATCFTVVNDGSEAAGCVVSASENAGSMVEVGTTIVLYIAGDVPADAPAEPEAPAGSEAPADSIEYDTD